MSRAEISDSVEREEEFQPLTRDSVQLHSLGTGFTACQLERDLSFYLSIRSKEISAFIFPTRTQNESNDRAK